MRAASNTFARFNAGQGGSLSAIKSNCHHEVASSEEQLRFAINIRLSGSDAAGKPFCSVLPPLTVIFLRNFMAIRTLISPIRLAVHLSFSLLPLVLHNYGLYRRSQPLS